MEAVFNCRKCELCKNQLPLLDNFKSSDVMWIGLSAKKVECVNKEIPFSVDTNSGKIIAAIEEKVGVDFYKTNLVKCLPLDKNEKLRYPNLEEKEKCYCNLVYEISKVKPKLVFLLGRIVSEFVLGRKDFRFDSDFNYKIVESNGINFVAIHHPSYIYVYKRSRIEDYIKGVVNLIASPGFAVASKKLGHGN